MAAVIVVVLLVAAGMYICGRWARAPPTGDDGSDGEPVVRTNESTFSVYLGALDPEPSLSSVTFRIHAPGLGHADIVPTPSGPGVLTGEDVFPGIDLEYHDLDNDAAAGNGDYFNVISTNGTLLAGIWHAELRYDGGTSGDLSFTFRALPAGTTSIAEDADVAFIDVGQGDAELIRTSDGKYVLIDAGTASSEDGLLAYLAGRSVTVLQALIVSHPDADHLGGARGVLEALEVRSVYHPGLAKGSASYEEFIAAAREEGCPIYTSGEVQAGDYLDLSVTEDFRVLSINASTEANDASIVLRMTSLSRSFLFTGDAGFEVEDALCAQYAKDIDVDVLKVGHHGSRTSTSATFLAAVTPALAVIEVGTNSYGHPTEATLSRLAAVGATVVRTDQAGTYVVTSSGGTYS